MAIQIYKLYDNKTYSLKRKFELYDQFYVIFDTRHHNRFCTNTYEMYLKGSHYSLYKLMVYSHGENNHDIIKSTIFYLEREATIWHMTVM